MGPVDGSLASMLRSCTTSRLWAEQDEGPYRRGSQPTRRDIVEDRDGTALQLGIGLVFDGDTPVNDAEVEVWHCDALGRYSGFAPPDDSVVVTAQNAPLAEYLPDQSFLRGGQRTDSAGMVEFRSVHPGWYPGRTVHIHLMVHIGDTTWTTQLYFPEEVNDEVLAHEPYSQRPDRDTTNDTDEIFPTGGDPAVLDVVAARDLYRAAVRLVVPASEAAGRPARVEDPS